MSETWPLTNGGKPWTEIQDALLREAYGKAPAERIARVVGRTITAVVQRAGELHLAKPRRAWTEAEVARLAKLRLKMPMWQVAEGLGRSKYSCERKALDMRKAGDGRFPILKKENK